MFGAWDQDTGHWEAVLPENQSVEMFCRTRRPMFQRCEQHRVLLCALCAGQEHITPPPP